MIYLYEFKGDSLMSKKVSGLIKDIRKINGLTQKQFVKIFL